VKKIVAKFQMGVEKIEKEIERRNGGRERRKGGGGGGGGLIKSVL